MSDALLGYAVLKFVHEGSAAASYTLFFLRGVWLLRGSPVMQQHWVKIAPHLVDTMLLASAIALAVQLGISPLHAPWLAAKIIALPVYVGLGFVAMRYARTHAARLTVWIVAQAVFFYIVAVAFTKTPQPWTAL